LKMVVGLGNPGAEYEFTRHNLGFRIIDNLARKFNMEFKKLKSCHSLISRGKINHQEVILIKPQTFMNLSGEAVSKIVFSYRIDFSDLLIVYDDLNLTLGQIRIRKKGSAGGHKGMESIIQYLGSEDLPRMRIGIGRPDPEVGEDCVSYVLSNFSPEEEEIIKKTIPLATEAIEKIIEDGLEEAMRKYSNKKLI